MQDSTPDNKLVAAHFKLLADLMELHGEGGFKSAAYNNAYRVLKNYDTPLVSLSIAALEEIPGIGKAIAAKIYELLHQNTFPLLEKYLSLTPPGVVEMLQIKGIGPKKIALLWKELGVESPGELYYACMENRLVTLNGFGEKTQENILQQLLFMQQAKGQLLFAQAEPIILALLQKLKAAWPDQLFEQTGEIRRKNNTISVLDILTDIPPRLLPKIVQSADLLPGTAPDLFKHNNGIAVRFHFTQKENIAIDLFTTTGISEHTEKIKSKISSGKTYASEEAIYTAAGLPFIPPEARENLREWTWASSGQPLVSLSSIKGIIHAHSTYSDGTHSLKEMATYCRDKGFLYLGISDHSQSAFYANGLKESDLLRQHEEIIALNAALAPFRIFKGIESDILNDGRLDYPDEILSTFDFVIASVHSVLKMEEERATSRLIKAIENPYTTILGHTTGRLLLSRPGYPVDHIKLINACAANGVAIELNANPYRLDIDWKWIPYCMDKGVKIAINPDAHNLSGIHDIRYGVTAARKGCLTVASCLNFMDTEDINKFFLQRKSTH